MDPIKKVRPGERLQIPARAWNRVLDTLGPNLGYAAGEPAGADPASNIVFVKNNFNAVPMFGVLAINGVVIDPSGGTLTGLNAIDTKAREFCRRPVLNGYQYDPSMPWTALVICVEPIAAGGVGRAAIGGCTACKVRVTSETHNHAGFHPGDYSQLLSSSCGPVRLAWKEPGIGVNKWAVGVF